MCISQLDNREITTSLGKQLLMILSPYIFLQVTPYTPLPDPAAATTLYWTPLSALVSLRNPPKWSTVSVDASSCLTPRHSRALRLLVCVLVGSMEFPAIVLDFYLRFPPLTAKTVPHQVHPRAVDKTPNRPSLNLSNFIKSNLTNRERLPERFTVW